jgi:hypothetical protein
MALRRVSISPHLLAFVGLLAASAAHAQPTSTNPLEIPSYNVAEVCSGMTARCVEEEQAALQDLSAVWPVLTASQLRYSLRQLMSMRASDGTYPRAYEHLLTIVSGIALTDDQKHDMSWPMIVPRQTPGGDIPVYSENDVCSQMVGDPAKVHQCRSMNLGALQTLEMLWPDLTASQRQYSLRQLMSMRDLDGSHPFAYYRLLTIAEGIARADDELREMGRPPLEPQ